MQMRCACTELTLGLKKAARSGEKDLWYVQSAIDAMIVSDTVQCANVALQTNKMVTYT
jgi:hypothetical protein